jgi:hypothetical protein
MGQRFRQKEGIAKLVLDPALERLHRENVLVFTLFSGHGDMPDTGKKVG